MPNEPLRVAMLCGKDRFSRMMYHALASTFDVQCVIVEDKPSSKTLIQRRIKKLGIMKTGGQVLFMLGSKLVAKRAAPRIDQLVRQYALDEAAVPENVIRTVDSVNSDETIRLLRDARPEAIVVNGTRIISKRVLAAVDAPFINTHMGITPKYRGVHGGYWALATGDPDNCGVTVHLVDQGIDTGGVLYQDTICPTPSDSFHTYPIHQIAKAIPLMRAALEDVRQRRIRIQPGVLPSRLWHHPTLFQYLKHRVQSGVR